MLIDRTGTAINDRWSRPEGGSPWPAGALLLPLTRLADVLDRQTDDLGVTLSSDVDWAALVPWLPRLVLVDVAFPGFRDGRGFTVARTLRERHGFAGDIRGSGKILPDQFVALLRVGFTTIELPDGNDLTPWRAALELNGELDHSAQALPWIRRSTLPFQPA